MGEEDMPVNDSAATTEDEARKLYASHGVGGRVGFGVRPAVIVVDFQQTYTRTWRSASLAPVQATAVLLAAAREQGVPVFYTYMGYDPEAPDAGVWGMKAATLVENVRGSWGCEIDQLIAPVDGDVVLEKRAPSSFFNTDLQQRLAALSVDTLVVCGTSLSGCVRATVVDGLSHNYRVLVPRDCVADASGPSMRASLNDIDTKYGDVISLDEAIAGLTARVVTEPGE
ncbi:isochorismatase family protein [Micromonospora sp. CB01531]|uniref:isochorismatase family protein n=1 Tax=Micromonospora sp. CB01531 TaxID=1718947 RepID=UPI0011614118|nr:isochorismatase family protein [Micromonospora sp. CB01531]